MTDTERRGAAFLDKHTPAVAMPLRDALAAAPPSTVIKRKVDPQRPRRPASQS